MCVNVNLYLYAFRDKSKRIHETRSAPILEGVTAEKYGAPITFIPYGFILIKQLITRIDIRSAQLVVSIGWYKVKFFKSNIPTDHTNTTSRRAIHIWSTNIFTNMYHNRLFSTTWIKQGRVPLFFLEFSLNKAIVWSSTQ